MATVSIIPARARVGCCHKKDFPREFNSGFIPCHSKSSLLQRLSQNFNNVSSEFGKLIKKKHTVMGQRQLPRLGDVPTTYHGSHSYSVVRGSKRSYGNRRTGILKLSRKGVNSSHLQFFLQCKRRQNPRYSLCQHGFPRAGISCHKYMMASRRPYYDGSLCFLLAFNLFKIGEIPKGSFLCLFYLLIIFFFFRQPFQKTHKIPSALYFYVLY